jgi:hypothetical protein
MMMLLRHTMALNGLPSGNSRCLMPSNILQSLAAAVAGLMAEAEVAPADCFMERPLLQVQAQQPSPLAEAEQGPLIMMSNQHPELTQH